jgi:hypothetical protein
MGSVGLKANHSGEGEQIANCQDQIAELPILGGLAFLFDK